MQQLQDLSVALDCLGWRTTLRLICSEIAFKATNLYNWDSLATLNCLKNRNVLPGRNSKVQLFRGLFGQKPHVDSRLVELSGLRCQSRTWQTSSQNIGSRSLFYALHICESF